jgi:hypothetical protein
MQGMINEENNNDIKRRKHAGNVEAVTTVVENARNDWACGVTISVSWTVDHGHEPRL